MKQQKIKNYNRLCAEFLGWEIGDIPDGLGGGKGWFKDSVYQCEVGLELFHEDWNSIREVVDVIEQIEIKESVKENTNIELNRYLGKVLDLPIYTKKEVIVEVINQFLIWYNENKN